MVHRPTDPRSPIQPGGSSLPKALLLALAAAASLWTWQQTRDRNDRPEPRDAMRPVHAPAPAPVRPGETSARARANLMTLFSGDNYPMKALRNDEQGTVGFRLTIDRRGRVTACDVISSSGSNSLDQTTCGILQRRARFEPARDRDGRTTGDSHAGRVRWVLPED